MPMPEVAHLSFDRPMLTHGGIDPFPIEDGVDEYVITIRRHGFAFVDITNEDGTTTRYEMVNNDSFRLSSDLIVYADEVAEKDPRSDWGTKKEDAHVH